MRPASVAGSSSGVMGSASSAPPRSTVSCKVRSGAAAMRPRSSWKLATSRPSTRTMRSPVASPAASAGVVPVTASMVYSEASTMRLSGLSMRNPNHQIALSTRIAKARLASGPARMMTMRRQAPAAKNDPGSAPTSSLPERDASRKPSSPFILQ